MLWAYALISDNKRNGREREIINHISQVDIKKSLNPHQLLTTTLDASHSFTFSFIQHIILSAYHLPVCKALGGLSVDKYSQSIFMEQESDGKDRQ